MELTSWKSTDNVTISYCDPFTILQQCHNIQEELYQEHLGITSKIIISQSAGLEPALPEGN